MGRVGREKRQERVRYVCAARWSVETEETARPKSASQSGTMLVQRLCGIYMVWYAYGTGTILYPAHTRHARVHGHPLKSSEFMQKTHALVNRAGSRADLPPAGQEAMHLPCDLPASFDPAAPTRHAHSPGSSLPPDAPARAHQRST